MKITNLTLFTVLIAAVSPLKATEIETIAGVGLDSNPLGLSEQLTPTQEEFAFAGLYSQSDVSDLFFWDVKVEKALYFNDSRVDWFDAGAMLKLASNFDIAEVPFAYEVGINYAKHDETYVSKETGFVTTFNGQSIADRFDNINKGYFAGFSYLIRSDADFFLRYANRETNFEFYDFVDLDNLDNDEATTTIGTHFSPNDSGKFYLQFNYHQRSYKDRRDRDLDGVQIAASDLVLNRYETELGYDYQFNARSLWRFGFSYENRTSNGTKYYESQRAALKIRGEHWLADYHRLSVKFDWQSFFYDESFDQSFVYYDKGDIEQNGIILGVEYTWVLATLFRTDLGFYVNAQASIFDGVNDFYDYQRNQVSAGIRWAID